MLDYILGTLQPNTDVAFVGYPFTDEFSHQFMGLVTPADIDGVSANERMPALRRYSERPLTRGFRSAPRFGSSRITGAVRSGWPTPGHGCSMCSF